MSLFRKRSSPAIDESVDDETWIRQGHKRFESDNSKHFGSPEMMRAGGDRALANGDPGAAIFYYSKAIDISQTWANHRPGERVVNLDVQLFDVYATTLENIRRARPGADVVTNNSINDNAAYALRMMISIRRIYADGGHPAPQLDRYIKRVAAVTGLTIQEGEQGSWTVR